MKKLLFFVGALLLFATGANAAVATTITIDLTQTGTESGSNIAGDTWRWNATDPTGDRFDLEFSSANGSHIDLDGGVRAGNEYFPGFGSMSATDHTYELLKAEYLGGTAWSVSGSRDGGTTFTSIGSITEYSGAISHVTNYGYGTAGLERSDPVNGPGGAGVNYSVWEPWKAWLWIYRDTATGANTISLNIVLGSAGAPPSGNIFDNGSFNSEVTIGGSYTGTAVELQGNEPGEVTGSNPFVLRHDWDAGYDDGAVLAGITPIVPEPATIGLLSLGALGLLRNRYRK